MGALVALVSPHWLPWPLRAVAGWIAAAVIMLGTSWHILLHSDARTTELRAGDEDPGRVATFVIAVVSSLFSVLAATMVLRLTRDESSGGFWVGLALVSVALSWFVTHTEYAFRYAHLYYARGGGGGLTFPDTAKPCDMDFAYYSLTIGMCFQVSDVMVTAANLRRLTLGHSLVSFLFNTTILALSLNVAFQLLG